MDLRTFHPVHVAVNRRRARPGAVANTSATHARSTGVAALGTASSMRMMEAGLAVVAIATAILLGLGR